MNINLDSLFFTLEVGPIDADQRVLLMESMKDKGINLKSTGFKSVAKFSRNHYKTISIEGISESE